MFKEQHHVIYIQGLHDQQVLNKKIASLLPRFWDDRGFPIHIVEPHWKKGESFQEKLKLVMELVDSLAEDRKVWIIGNSEGGCLALSTYAVRRNDLIAGIDVTGRLSEGIDEIPSLEHAAKTSPAFKNGVLQFEKYYAPTLYPGDRERIMTIRAWGDKVAPSSTVYLKGAKNVAVPVFEHSLGGIFMMTFGAYLLQGFLEETDTKFPRNKSYSLNRIRRSTSVPSRQRKK